MALAEILAFWCGGDTEQMDRLFRQSGLMRDKWDRVRSGSTYGMLTLTKAVKKCSAFYSPMMTTADEDFNDILARLTEFNLLKNIRYRSGDIGYGICGDTRYECMFFLYGETTRNGKETLMESVLKVLGDYGKAVRPETIAQKHSFNLQAPSEEIARLAGIRFANIIWYAILC